MHICIYSGVLGCSGGDAYRNYYYYYYNPLFSLPSPFLYIINISDCQAASVQHVNVSLSLFASNLQQFKKKK